MVVCMQVALMCASEHPAAVTSSACTSSASAIHHACTQLGRHVGPSDSTCTHAQAPTGPPSSSSSSSSSSNSSHSRTAPTGASTARQHRARMAPTRMAALAGSPSSSSSSSRVEPTVLAEGAGGAEGGMAATRGPMGLLGAATGLELTQATELALGLSCGTMQPPVSCPSPL